MAQHSKAYRAAAATIDKTRIYPPLEAIRLAQKTSSTKYDATVEVAFRLGVDPRKADQMVRGTVNLPHGTGKTARVLVFAVGERAEQAIAAGRRRGRRRRADREGRGRLHRLRRGRRDAGPDGQGRTARQGARPARPDAEPEDRHRDDGRGQGRHRDQGRQDRVPRRQAREPALHHRQGVVPRHALVENYARRARRDPPAQAGGVQGPLHHQGVRHDDDGPEHPARPEQDAHLTEESDEG